MSGNLSAFDCALLATVALIAGAGGLWCLYCSYLPAKSLVFADKYTEKAVGFP